MVKTAASQGHVIGYTVHDTEVMGLNLVRVNFGAHKAIFYCLLQLCHCTNSMK